MRSRYIAMRCMLAALLLICTLATGAQVAQAAPDHTPVPPSCASTFIQRVTVTLVKLFIDPHAACYEQPFSLIGLARTKVQASVAQFWATVMDAIWAQVRTPGNKR
jgi:hypothetical protein